MSTRKDGRFIGHWIIKHGALCRQLALDSSEEPLMPTILIKLGAAHRGGEGEEIPCMIDYFIHAIPLTVQPHSDRSSEFLMRTHPKLYCSMSTGFTRMVLKRHTTFARYFLATILFDISVIRIKTAGRISNLICVYFYFCFFYTSRVKSH